MTYFDLIKLNWA